MPRPTLLTIGQLATRGGIAASAIRFYEAQGLLRSSRSETGQRRYQRDALRRVAIIRAAQHVGLSLEEIHKAISVLPDGDNATEADWEALAAAWQAKLEQRQRLVEQLLTDRGSCIGCGCMVLDDCSRSNPDDVAYKLGHGAQYLKGRTPADAGVDR